MNRNQTSSLHVNKIQKGSKHFERKSNRFIKKYIYQTYSDNPSDIHSIIILITVHIFIWGFYAIEYTIVYWYICL